MNAMGRFTIASLRRNRVRTLVTIAGVALAAALLTAVLTSYTSLTHYLYESEAALSGTWTAAAEAPDSEQFRQQIDGAHNTSEVRGLATVQDVGFAQLTEEQQVRFGKYLPILDVSGEVGEVCAIRSSEGRMPERAGEIMLPEFWHSRALANVGDTLTLQVGQRRAVAVSAPEQTAAASGPEVEDELYPNGQYGSVVEETHPLEDGAILDSTIGYLDSELDGGRFDEELSDLRERTYTVVGFYERVNSVLMNGIGPSAVTVGDPEAAGLMCAYVDLTGEANEKALVERAEELFPEATVTSHSTMLRYLGIRGAGYIWDTFFGLAVVLAVVIVAACVSLIYNAFAISVAERTNQFGLLSSVGASRKQLRRAVLLEALLVVCIGIPLGLLAGVGGCAVTFAFIGPMIAAVLGDMGVPFVTHVEPWVLVGASALTLVTVLVSAYLPAKRASRLNIIEALRWSQGGQVSKRGVRLAARNTDASKLWKRGIGPGRLLGAGGMLARITKKRGATKGRTAAVSLALAIALLVTAGSLSTLLGRLTEVASSSIDYDLELSVSVTDPDKSTLGALSSEGGREGPMSIYAAAAEVPEVEQVGWALSSFMPAILDDEMVGNALASSRIVDAGRMSDGRCAVDALAYFLEDDAFEAYAREAGADPADFLDPTHPRAIAVSTAYGNDGERYQVEEMLRGTGSVELYVGGTYDGDPISGFGSQWQAHDGAPNSIDIYAFVVDETGAGVQVDDLSDPLLSLDTMSVEVAALTDSVPPIVHRSEAVQLIMPQALLPAFAHASIPGSSMAGYDVVEGLSSQAAEAVERAAAERVAELGEAEYFPFINDYASMEDSNNVLALIVNVFCLLFTVILALIAMANVFNTVTNSLILRRREFAIMRSIGLSGRQFRRMIASECARFAVIGLVAGLVIATGVSFLIFSVVTQSMVGLNFGLPWNYVALAIGMTVLVMVASVAYGMHRCKADNVVEALRMESI